MAGEGDLAVIYIATHGTAREQDVAGANYVVTYDSDVESLDGLYSTANPWSRSRMTFAPAYARSKLNPTAWLISRPR